MFSLSCLLSGKHSAPAGVVLLWLLLQEAVGAMEIPREGGLPQGGPWGPHLPQGFTNGARILGQPLDVFEGQVDNLITAGITVQVPTG